MFRLYPKVGTIKLSIFIPPEFSIKNKSSLLLKDLDENTFNTVRDYEELCTRLSMSISFEIISKINQRDLGFLVAESCEYWLLFQGADRARANFFAIHCSNLDIWTQPVKGATYSFGVSNKIGRRSPIIQHSYFTLRNNYLDFIGRIPVSSDNSEASSSDNTKSSFMLNNNITDLKKRYPDSFEAISLDSLGL